MRRIMSLFIVFLIPTWISAQKVTKNPDQPADARAGRVLQLNKELTVTDEQGEFYFKSPKNIQIAPDGSIFLLDEDQFLKFDADGKFLKNLFRIGQGPGEVEQISDYIFSDGQIAVLQAQPNKIVLMDMQGEFLREIKPDEACYRLFTFYNGRYYGAQNSRPQFGKLGDEPKILDITWNFRIASDTGEVEVTDLNFPVTWYAQRIESAVIANNIVDFMAFPAQDRYMVISHTQKYLLKLLDLESGQVIREFSREYARIRMKPDKTGKAEVRPDTFALVPPVDHYNDIQKFFIMEDRIWVMTSTMEKEKGFLVDVFDMAGRYLDNFYLPLQDSIKQAGLARHPLTIHGGCVYVMEYDADDIPALVKYRITN